MAIVDNKAFFNSLKKAKRGKKLLKSIIIKENIDLNMDFIILLPGIDKECNFYTLLYLNQLVKQFEEDKDKKEKNNIPTFRQNEKFIILTQDNRVEQLATIIFSRTTKVIMLDKSDIDCIVKRYSFMEVAKHHFIISSLDEPNGRQCRGLVNERLTTISEIIAVGILGVRYNNYIKWQTPLIPKISLNNSELFSFMYEHCEG